MDDKKNVVVQNADGSTMEVELITYLVSDDKSRTYIVYSKGEKNGIEEDEVIYISKVVKENDVLKLLGLRDNNEWTDVQGLLKKIANA